MLIVLCLLLLATAYIPYHIQIKHKYLVFRLTKLYYKSWIKTHLLTMTDTRKVI